MENKNKEILASDLHFEHNQWIKELKFWKDELLSFQHRLEEVSLRGTTQNVKAKVEHFQNQFIIHNTLITKLLERIGEQEHHLAVLLKAHANAIEEEHFQDHPKHRIEIDTERKIFQELKKEFFSFLTKV